MAISLSIFISLVVSLARSVASNSFFNRLFLKKTLFFNKEKNTCFFLKKVPSFLKKTPEPDALCLCKLAG